MNLVRRMGVRESETSAVRGWEEIHSWLWWASSDWMPSNLAISLSTFRRSSWMSLDALRFQLEEGGRRRGRCGWELRWLRAEGARVEAFLVARPSARSQEI